jgi:hypothetical protein
MTQKQLDYALELSERIESLEIIIANAKSQVCEWIDFNFGNGSNRKSVCNDESIIESVRALLIQENEKKLATLKQEFEAL